MVVEGNREVGYASVKGSVNDDCAVVVDEVEFARSVEPESGEKGRGVSPEPEVSPDATLSKDADAPLLGRLFQPLVAKAGHITVQKGWAKAELNDCCTIDLTVSYAEMKYYDDGERVWNGHDPNNGCYYYSDGWVNTSCVTWWWPYGDTYVYTKTEGEYDHLWSSHSHRSWGQYTGTQERVEGDL